MKTIQITPFRNIFRAAASIALLAIFCSMAFNRVPSAEAASTSGFNAGNIMSNAVMSNKSTMTQSQIQSFMLSKNSCNKSVSSAGGNVIDDSATQAHWVGGSVTYQISGGKKGTTNGAFSCLAKSSFSGQSASQIIYQASQDYNVNPQVFIVLLEKEQGLITDLWPNSTQLASATGYNCPDDDAGCRGSDAAFKKQIRGAGNMFNSILTQKVGWTNFYPVGTNYIQYNPSASCGGSNVNIQNLATSALYNYTPYQPNAATLKAGWPSPGASCGAYGNLNFYMYFKTWFGSPTIGIQGSIAKYYNANNGSTVLGSPVDNQHQASSGFWWQKFEKGYIIGQANTGYYAVKGSIGSFYGSNNGLSYLGKPLGGEIKATDGSWSQKFQNGFISGQSDTGYFMIKGSIGAYYGTTGVRTTLGFPLSAEVSLGNGGWEQKFSNGYITGKYATGYWISSGAIRDVWISSGYKTSPLGLPIGSEQALSKEGTYQPYENGFISGSKTAKYWQVKGSIGKRYGTSNNTNAMGAPLEDQESLGNDIWQQKFQQGYIKGSYDTGYWMIRGSIYDYWSIHNSESSRLELPVSEIKKLSDGWTQRFQGGAIAGSTNTKYWAVVGSIGKTYTSLKDPSKLGLPTNNETQDKNGIWSQTFEHGKITGSNGKYKVIYK